LLSFSPLGLSFNQPQFCSKSNWNPNGITFADHSIVGQGTLVVFVNTDNTVYTANRQKKEILVWNENSIKPNKTISGDFSDVFSLFVTSNGDIYIDNGVNRRVMKWISNTNTFVTVMNVKSACSGLFVDINDNLYCSMFDYNQVVKRSLNDPLMALTVVAGTGREGSGSNELDRPQGIFVDVNLDLYVTDCENNRVQLFQLGQSNGITVAGERTQNPTISLRCPSGVVLDSDKYLFIVDSVNNRIIGSGINGFRCLVGCHGMGSQSNQLFQPRSLSFDRDRNMFVNDKYNHRIQKFEYLDNSIGKSKMFE
jgi:sugar lactone lactonase YvrE